MNTIDTEQQRLQTYYQTYLRTITQTDSFVNFLRKTILKLTMNLNIF